MALGDERDHPRDPSASSGSPQSMSPHDSESSDGEANEESSTSGSSSSSSSSSSPRSPEAGRKPLPPLPPPAAPPAPPVANPASPRRALESPKPSQGPAAAVAKQSLCFRGRNAFARTPFGYAHYTPKMNDAGDVASIQMTCAHPAHKGGALCQKTFSVTLAGSEDMAIRMLKCWLVRGLTSASKVRHAEQWPQVRNTMPSHRT